MASCQPHDEVDDDGDATVVTLELCGYDVASAAFLLSASADGASGGSSDKRSRPESYLRRELADFQRWDRQFARTPQTQSQPPTGAALHQAPPLLPLERLPMRRLRKLTAQSWLKHDAASGWRLELQKNVAASDAWLNAAFRRLSPAQRADFLHTERYEQLQRERVLARSDAQHARSLQQYFTSQPLVDLTLERVAAILRARHPDEPHPLTSDRFVWLEPSCGDGRFVTSLLRAGATHVVGVEIDGALCREARASAQEFAASRVEIRQNDFLATTRAPDDVSAEQVVVAVGNPPFGDKVDGSVSADLIQRFVRHAAREWRAQLLAFIVPERCARASYTELTLATLAKCRSDKVVASGEEDEEREKGESEGEGGEWHLAAVETLNDFHFEFRGGAKRIKQPSALMIYTKASRSSNSNSSAGSGC